ncbi:hypothetical protein BLNAU_1190 [Blattamonas nauphoetae]|uniref:Uncharacterized protein n=1 Tax=Blattamonas nauphoetae TaxID=2049346 RepID=A0ABQ9YIN9_9EUKA|nr:hypothetical protein BLNAU_1190 [Blattamonas nauphoetae]
MQEPFLVFDPKTELSFDDKSSIYCSLATLVKAEHRSNNALEDRATRFLTSLAPKFGDFSLSAKLVTDLVPSSTGSHSGFVESIVTLLSSPHSTIVEAALLFLNVTTWNLPTRFLSRLAEVDIITNALAAVQPHTLPITGFEETHRYLIRIVDIFVDLASQSNLRDLGITATVDKSNHLEMIFQKVVIPSSQIVTFLISNRNLLKGNLLDSFMILLRTLLEVGPFHRPTLEFVLASPIVMAFSSCLPFAEEAVILFIHLGNINNSLKEWRNHGPEVVQSAKRMMQALISEGFEDTLEQMMMYEKNDDYCPNIIKACCFISQWLGSNVEFTENDDD